VIGLTTGRRTSQRLNSLLRDLAHIIPRTKIVRRGKSSLDDLTALFLEQGLDHAVVIHRWHGASGRIDFYNIRTASMEPVPPSVLFSSIRLRRDQEVRRRQWVEAISHDPAVSEEARGFSRTLAGVLELPETSAPIDPRVRATIHVRERSDKHIEVAASSSPVMAEIGLKLLVSRLLWDL